MGNFRHRQLSLVDQLFRALDTRGARRGGGCRAKMLAKEARQLPRSDAEPLRKIIDPPLVQRTFRNQPQRPGDGRP